MTTMAERSKGSSAECAFGTGIAFHAAIRAEDRLAAAALVGRRYSQEGYLDHDGPFRIPHQELPAARVFFAETEGRIAGTLTAVVDSHLGLPSELLCPGILARLRAKGRRPSELCSLAMDEGCAASGEVLAGLFRIAFAYLYFGSDATDALITLKPSHCAFYERRMGFVRLGATLHDPRFNDAETVVLGLSRERVNCASTRFVERTGTLAETFGVGRARWSFLCSRRCEVHGI